MDICYLVLHFFVYFVKYIFLLKNPTSPTKAQKEISICLFFISLAAIVYDYSIFLDNAKRPIYKYQI